MKLYGQLRRYRPADAPGAPHHPFKLIVNEEDTAVSLITQLAIPDGLVNAVAINGEATDQLTTLRPGDQVGMFPPSAGGCQ